VRDLARSNRASASDALRTSQILFQAWPQIKLKMKESQRLAKLHCHGED